MDHDQNAFMCDSDTMTRSTIKICLLFYLQIYKKIHNLASYMYFSSINLMVQTKKAASKVVLWNES